MKQENYHRVLTIARLFAATLSVRMKRYITDVVMAEARKHQGIKPAFDTLMENLREKEKGTDLFVELMTSSQHSGPDGAIKVLLGVPVMGEALENLGVATISLFYWVDKEEVCLNDFTVVPADAGFRYPHIALSFKQLSDRSVFGMEVEAINAEAWKRVRDTLHVLAQHCPFDNESRERLLTLHRMAPTL